MVVLIFIRSVFYGAEVRDGARGNSDGGTSLTFGASNPELIPTTTSEMFRRN